MISTLQVFFEDVSILLISIVFIII